MVMHNVYRSLKGRKQITKAETQAFYRMQSGLEGETLFHELLDAKFSEAYKILYDLNLSFNGKEVQIDFLILRSDVVYHFEVKHFRGDYLIKDERWYRREGGEIENPLYQMKRAQIFLEHLLKVPVESRLVFSHDSFHLYQSNPHLPIYLRSQFGRLFSEMRQVRQGNRLVLEKLEKEINKYLIGKSKYEVQPEYTFESLKKGLLCADCRIGLKFKTQRKLICPKCQDARLLKEILDLQVAELKTLFPDKKLTKGLLYDWCGGQIKMRTVQKYLTKYYITVFNGKSSYYLSKM